MKNNHPFYFLPAPTPHLPKIKVAGSVRAEGSSCKMSRHPHFSQGREVFMQNVPSSTLQSGQRGLHAKCPVIHTSVRAEGSSCKMSRHPHFSQGRGVFMQNVPSSTLQSGQRGFHAKCPVIHTSIRTERSSCSVPCHHTTALPSKVLDNLFTAEWISPKILPADFSFGAVTQGWPRVGCVPNQYHC